MDIITADSTSRHQFQVWQRGTDSFDIGGAQLTCRKHLDKVGTLFPGNLDLGRRVCTDSCRYISLMGSLDNLRFHNRTDYKLCTCLNHFPGHIRTQNRADPHKDILPHLFPEGFNAVQYAGNGHGQLNKGDPPFEQSFCHREYILRTVKPHNGNQFPLLDNLNDLLAIHGSLWLNVYHYVVLCKSNYGVWRAGI